MNGPCESCHLKPSTQVLNFDGDERFLVCDSCAEVAEGYYGTSEPIAALITEPVTTARTKSEQLILPFEVSP